MLIDLLFYGFIALNTSATILTHAEKNSVQQTVK
jgi:hypothetical protein